MLATFILLAGSVCLGVMHRHNLVLVTPFEPRGHGSWSKFSYAEKGGGFFTQLVLGMLLVTL